MSKKHFNECLYFAIKITINRYTVYREIFNFSHNILIRRSQFKSELLLEAQVLHFLFHSKKVGHENSDFRNFPSSGVQPKIREIYDFLKEPFFFNGGQIFQDEFL